MATLRAICLLVGLGAMACSYDPSETQRMPEPTCVVFMNQHDPPPPRGAPPGVPTPPWHSCTFEFNPTPAPPPEAYPAGTSTGLYGIDLVIDAFNNGERQKLLDSLHTLSAPCKESPRGGIFVEPICKPDQPAGTPTQAYLIGQCLEPGTVDASLSAQPLLANWIDLALRTGLYVAAVSRTRPSLPVAGEVFTVIFGGERRWTLYVDVSGIVGYGQCDSPLATKDLPGADFVLPPK